MGVTTRDYGKRYISLEGMSQEKKMRQDSDGVCMRKETWKVAGAADLRAHMTAGLCLDSVYSHGSGGNTLRGLASSISLHRGEVTSI